MSNGIPTPHATQRRILIQGTKGIGRSLARSLRKREAKVTVAGRTDPNESGIDFIKCDLSTVAAMHKFAASLKAPEKLDFLIFTTGIFAPPTLTRTSDGVEIDLAVSYLSRRVILEDLLARGLKARTFVMGYSGEDVSLSMPLNGDDGNYSLMAQHMNTVVANDALVLGTRTRHPKFEIYGLNPGLLASDIRSALYDGFPMKYLGIALEAVLKVLVRSTDDYAEGIMDVITASTLPEAVLFNPFGESIHVSPFLSKPANVEVIFSETDKVLAEVEK